ncbi:head-tail connector protein [Pseudomonas oryzihabitans]|uniref:head-tail connector protein n=1 Tax=Pseudomonas oryzihabitans TaxID=47885 RepID=UPI003EBCD28F
MSVISIAIAMQHLLAEEEDQVLVQAMLDAAEESASQYMQRRFYADQAALDAAQAEVPAAISSTRIRYEHAVAAADVVVDLNDRQGARDRAAQAFADARAEVEMKARGVVINSAIQAACLLILGHLFANREDVVTGTISTEIPMGSRHLLAPFRTGMGV